MSQMADKSILRQWAGPLVLLSLAASEPVRDSETQLPMELRVCAEPYDGVRTKGVEYLVATARADTVPVGGGLFGQVTDVSRNGGGTGDDFSGRSVLLVPWGFNDDCTPIPWTGSWLWASVGEASFFRGRLRSQDLWVDERPTVDVYRAVWEGFPNSPWDHPMQGGEMVLTADELFDLNQLLPTETEVAERPYGAMSELVDWRRNAGDMVMRYPARAILESAFRIAEVARVRKAPIPFAGTYRVQVIDPQGAVVSTFFMRTGMGATAPVRNSANDDSDEVMAAPMPTGAFVAPAALSLTASALDVPPSGEGPSTCTRLMGLYGAEEVTDIEGAAKAWKADLPLLSVATCFRNSEYLKDVRASQVSAESADQSGTESFTGVFRQEEDGRFTFRQPIELPDDVRALLVGERISLESLPLVDPTSHPDS